MSGLLDRVRTGWREELVAPDSIVTVVSIVVAIPASYLIAGRWGSAVFYPAVFAIGTGPTFAFRNLEPSIRSTGELVAIGLVLSAVSVGAFVGVLLALLGVGLGTMTAGAGAFVVTFLGVTSLARHV